MPTDHAILSASSSKQWLSCPPSARLSAQYPDTTSDFAKEGTLAHALAELKLRKSVLGTVTARAFNAEKKKLVADELYQPEMDAHTDTYVDHILDIVHALDSAPYVAVEKHLDLSAYVPEGFGTGDCIVLHDSRLWICDLKYGKGVAVDAEGNTQMRLYALGAVSTYNILYPIKEVITTIIQPRLNSVSTETISIEDLLAWGESIKPIAQLAWEGKGEYQPGDHCRFCRARSVCRARADAQLALAGFNNAMPPILSNEEIGSILEQGRDLAKWVADLEEYALAQSLSGAEIPGWKAVEGRGSRQYVDLDAAFKAVVAAGYDEAILYERRPLTVPALEKVLGKPKYAEILAPYVEQKPGKPTLVPAADKREPITLQVTPEQAFKN